MDLWVSTFTTLDVTRKVQLPGQVVFLFLFFWTVEVIFIVWDRIKNRRRGQ